MAVVVGKKENLGSGITIYDFEIQANEEQDAEVYQRGRELENSIPATRAASESPRD